MENYYQLLGLPVDATAEEIKQRCLELGQAVRPDKHGGRAEREQFEEIERAFITLANPDSRAAYEAALGVSTWREVDASSLEAGYSEHRMTKWRILKLNIGALCILFTVACLSYFGQQRETELEQVRAQVSREVAEIDKRNTEKEASNARQEAELQAEIEKCDPTLVRYRASLDGNSVSERDAERLCRAGASIVVNDRRNSGRH